MTGRMIRSTLFAVLAFAAVLFNGSPSAVFGQLIGFVPAGVEIDAEGVLRAKIYEDPNGELTRQRIAAARQSLAGDLQKPSPLRKVSLNRMEAEIEKRLASGAPIDEAMRNLAGLTSISHVFFYPESRDIVIAGPAEGFFMDPSGRMIGIETGRAVMQLEDLLAALRAHAPNSPSARVIGCSIDPTKEGLASYSAKVNEIAQLTRSNRLPIAGNEIAIGEELRKALGLQQVSVHGVAANSHFAKVLVEADYRMKLIGIGLETPPVKIAVWAENVKARSVARNGLQRWYFTPDYQRISVNPDETAMQLVGDGVKLIGADERVGNDGTRTASSGVDRASANFTRTFTEKFGDIAQRSPVFAQLRNLMDLSIVAAFIKEMDYYGKAGWNMSTFGDESKLPIETWQAPKLVEPVVNPLYKDGRLAPAIGGGVLIKSNEALATENMKVDESGKVDEARNSVRVDGLGEGQWWWD
jgi:Protein of unknown function (DUF1598)